MMTGKAGKSIWMLLYLQQFRVPPFQMMFGIEVRFPLEAEKEGDSVIFADSVLTNTGVEDVFERIAEKQESIFEGNTQKSQKKQKEQHLKRKGLVYHSFKVGDLVLRRNTKQT